MSQLRVAVIVEGFGDAAAVPILLRRIWSELLSRSFIDVLYPIRIPRSKLTKYDSQQNAVLPNEAELGRALELAMGKIEAQSDNPLPGLILILFDANGDCPAILAPAILQCAAARAPGCDVVCVLPKPEYETWFVGVAESLRDYLSLSPNESIPEDPEGQKKRKGWIGKRFKNVRYSETADQPALTACMNLDLCRKRCPSFDKLCRELEKRGKRASAD